MNCSKCLKALPLSAFRVMSTGYIRTDCKECESEQKKRRYALTKEDQSAKSRARYQKPEVKERKIATGKIWEKKNPAKRAAKCSKRQASKSLRTPKWLSKLDLDHIQMFYEAAAFMTKETGVRFEVDHIVPLRGQTVSGLHVPWNLQVIEAKENRLKGNKLCK